MSIIKSFSVKDNNGQPGDMFYILHSSSNFTIIDCCMDDERKPEIIQELKHHKIGKSVIRLISTHPDEDHICGLKDLDKELDIRNFYCVENSAIKPEPSEDFRYYCKIRDSKIAYHLEKGCKRKWLNQNDENDGKNYGCSGINILWPNVDNCYFIDALSKAKEGIAYNNISPIFTYSLANGVKAMWMGDLESDYVENIKNDVNWQKIDILFAPHHGRKSGKLPAEVLGKLDPGLIVIGDAPSDELDYYKYYDTITQNSAGDITFDCHGNMVDIYVSKENYLGRIDFLENMFNDDKYGHYLGTLIIGEK